MSAPTESSDETLAKIAYTAWCGHDPDEGNWLLYGPLNEDEGEVIREGYLDIARALREALTPAVAPLAPGEVVRIPDGCPPSDGGRLRVMLTRDGEFLAVSPRFANKRGQPPALLDLAGVRQLEATCRRARAALEGA